MAALTWRMGVLEQLNLTPNVGNDTRKRNDARRYSDRAKAIRVAHAAIVGRADSRDAMTCLRRNITPWAERLTSFRRFSGYLNPIEAILRGAV